jgi:hypothetical protein
VIVGTGVGPLPWLSDPHPISAEKAANPIATSLRTLALSWRAAMAAGSIAAIGPRIKDTGSE